MEKFWQRNTALKIISIIIAIVIWLYVTGATNPTSETVVNVPLETRSLDNDLVIEDKPASVNVRLEGKKQVVESISSRDVRAIVDLRDVRIGKNELRVEVHAPQNVELVAVEPGEVSVTVDQISDSQFPVTISFTGRPAPGFTSLEPVLTPSRVIIAGPRNALNQIKRAYVKIELNKVSQNIMENFPVQVEDQLGNSLMEFVRVIPQTVEVFIPVVRELPGRQTAIRPLLEGQPAEGFEVKRIVTEPDLIKVYGSMDKLQDLQYLNTAPVDIEGAEKDVQQQVQLRLPPGITPGVFTPIQVLVEIGPVPVENLETE